MKIDENTTEEDFKAFKAKVEKMPDGPTKEALLKDLEIKKKKIVTK